MENGITFLQCDRTWIAIRGLGTSSLKEDTTLSTKPKGKDHGRFPNHKVLSAHGDGGAFCGLAIEVGEKQSHGSFAAFKKAAPFAEVDTSEIDKGKVSYKSADGKQLSIHWNDDPLNLGVWRNGKRRNLADAALYESPVIRSAWGSGILEVITPDAEFRHEVK